MEDDWEEDVDGEEDTEGSYEKTKEMPIYKKAMEIVQIAHTIVTNISENKDIFHMHELMLPNAYLLGAKIAGAQGAGLYTLKMENAVLIKVSARELMAQTNLLRENDACPEAYIQLLRNEINNFRLLFIDWVNTFDKEDDVEDEWGDLFR